MTKTAFNNKIQYCDENTKFLVQAIELEDGTKEIQVSEYSEEKVTYIQNNYNDFMEHKRNNKVRIIDIMVA